MITAAFEAGIDPLSATKSVRHVWPEGYINFLDRVVNRILRDHGEEICINRCPKCQAVLRTPKAKICLWCNHSQYGKGPG
jgi:hypothetical protein